MRRQMAAIIAVLRATPGKLWKMSQFPPGFPDMKG